MAENKEKLTALLATQTCDKKRWRSVEPQWFEAQEELENSL